MQPSTKPAQHRGPAGLIGEMAGEYRIERVLGAGGFGTVYEAEHPVLERRAAIKVLHADAVSARNRSRVAAVGGLGIGASALLVGLSLYQLGRMCGNATSSSRVDLLAADQSVRLCRHQACEIGS